MSFADDLADRSPESLVVQYVVECRGQGHFLPYADYDIIREWLEVAPNSEDLLLILSDILPDYFAKSGDGPQRSLAAARRLVLSCLREKSLRRSAFGDF